MFLLSNLQLPAELVEKNGEVRNLLENYALFTPDLCMAHFFLSWLSSSKQKDELAQLTLSVTPSAQLTLNSSSLSSAHAQLKFGETFKLT